jgi:hypothetical protein
MAEVKCFVKDCMETAMYSHQLGRSCIFHLESNSKKNATLLENFGSGIKAKLLKKDYNFRNFHFPAFHDFTGHVFDNDVDFSGATFDGKEDISETQNRMPSCVNFSRAIFRKNAIFEQSQFNGGDALFIDAKFLGEKANFNGAQFRGGYGRFTKAEFNNSEKTDFDGAKFHKGANFKSAQFNSKEIGFWEAEVLDGNAFFWGVKFTGYRANFSNFKINGGNAEFNDCEFQGIYISIENSQFSNDLAFNRTKFNISPLNIIDTTINGNCEFEDAKFSECSFQMQLSSIKGDIIFNDSLVIGDALILQNVDIEGDTEFNNADISSDNVIFENIKFNGNLHFINTIFRVGIDFSTCSHRSDSGFRMENIKIKFSPGFDDPNKPSILNDRLIFNRFPFNPFMSNIEGIKLEDEKSDGAAIPHAYILFRYCQLKDVYFAKNDMKLFSFYKSTFDGARFFSSEWGNQKEAIGKIMSKILPFLKYDRKNILYEEKLLTALKRLKDDNEISKIKENYRLDDINGYEDVGTLYRSMKTALDNSKDYQEAGWFYFNEFEMKRLALIDKIREESKKSDGSPKRFRRAFKSILSKRPLYCVYKVFAGYGEKPLWSAIWFVIYSALAAIFQLFSGIQLKVGTKIINYDLSSNIGTLFSGQLWCDICETWKYSVYRLIPNNYFTAKDSIFIPIDDWGVFLTIVNTVILALFIVFIGIGLKRHFRRF